MRILTSLSREGYVWKQENGDRIHEDVTIRAGLEPIEGGQARSWIAGRVELTREVRAKTR